MGSAHSKKRRKEKKKRKWSWPDTGIPRSASVDVIRSLQISPCCPQCGRLNSNKTASSSHLLHDRCSNREFPESSPAWSGAMTRTFSDSLTRPFQQHRCVGAHCGPGQTSSFYDRGRDSARQVDSDSGEGYSDYATSQTFLRPRGADSDRRLESLETSTMSLNRGLNGRQFNIVQSRSSDFHEIRSALYSSHREDRFSTLSTHSPSLMDSSALRHTFTESSHVQHRSSEVVSQTMSTRPQIILTTPGDRIKSADGLESKENQITQNWEGSGGKLSLLEDEPSRLARWEKRKLMAQQLRMLRKHIEAQENSSSSVVPRTLLQSRAAETDQSQEGTESQKPPDPTSPFSVTTVTSSSQTLNSAGSTCSPTHRKTTRSKFSKMSNYRYLDNHPLLSKLQNEQNNRLESMERRMREIKTSAMQEAERRRFAEIFPAKEDTSKTERLMQEARKTLELFKEEKKKKKRSSQNASKPDNVSTPSMSSPESNTQSRTVNQTTSSTSSDAWDIIPVHVVQEGKGNPSDWTTRSSSSKGRGRDSPSNERKHLKGGVAQSNGKADWLNEMWPHINLGQPFTWLLLPFLLFPLVLRLLLTVIISTTNTSASMTTTTITTPATTSPDNTTNSSINESLLLSGHCSTSNLRDKNRTSPEKRRAKI